MYFIMVEIKLTEKQRAWLFSYLDKNNEKTYMNSTQSAAAAGYRGDFMSLANIGKANRNSSVLRPFIDQYLDDTGLSNDALDAKMKALIDAKETKFFSKDGVITDQVEVEALEVQRRTLDMANKLKGRYEAHNKQQQVIIQPPGVDPPDDMGT